MAKCTQKPVFHCRQQGEQDRVGRKTGSLAWRLARGELGAESHVTSHVFIPAPGMDGRFKLMEVL